MINNNKGVNIVELVITIILLILIAAFAIISATATNTKAEATALYAEMKALRTGITQVKMDYDAGFINVIFYKEKIENITEEERDNSGFDLYYNGYDEEKDLFIIYGLKNDAYSQTVINNLGLDELKRTYLVDFDTKEVRLEESVTIAGYEIETYDEMRVLMESGAL